MDNKGFDLIPSDNNPTSNILANKLNIIIPQNGIQDLFSSLRMQKKRPIILSVWIQPSLISTIPFFRKRYWLMPKNNTLFLEHKIMPIPSTNKLVFPSEESIQMKQIIDLKKQRLYESLKQQLEKQKIDHEKNK